MSKSDTIPTFNIEQIPGRSMSGRKHPHDAAIRKTLDEAISSAKVKGFGPLPTRSAQSSIVNFVKRLLKVEAGYATLEVAARQVGEEYFVYVGPRAPA